jgi:hypothetical protein
MFPREAIMLSLQVVIDLAYALRNPMRPAGVRRNPAPHLGQLDGEYEEAEADYRRVQGIAGRPPLASKFSLHGREYLWDQADRIVRREMELDRPEGQRSTAAKCLAACLHYEELHTHHVLAAREKLEAIYRQLRPIDQPHPVHFTAPTRITGRADAA